ncbi:DeoR/GlpR family DNA-binding transcription regulator [Epibacterium sp. MM17-32]|uniref:DeoR/GlpR family DNA-binding transcription regulator n=1 Tax=Epibacterium sp. MM17-32 TaxID=2917734 RepID=UPI001EF5A361|nr:DeoR/GlpR family DNA-binding transcription regulator [Epibacterium sp. MM17-32]MCG7629177.1 DeoR/GlpR family DNA-binding transcription regulator [Epibacterium sp. MM17-32]
MVDSQKIPHRGHEVLEVLARFGGSARNAQIAHALGVSEETIRRLVRSLAHAGKVDRVHGGTVLRPAHGAPVFSTPLATNTAAKSAIARTAAALLSDRMTVFVNVGSTTTYVAEHLRQHRELTVVTNSLPAMAALVGHNGNRVYLTGGQVLSGERGSFGSMAETQAQQFSYDAVILGADGISPRHGFVTSNPQEADLTHAVAVRADRVIVVADLSKRDTRAPFVTCPLDRVSDFVTDQDPDPELATALREWGITTHTAPSADEGAAAQTNTRAPRN